MKHAMSVGGSVHGAHHRQRPRKQANQSSRRIPPEFLRPRATTDKLNRNIARTLSRPSRSSIFPCFFFILPIFRAAGDQFLTIIFCNRTPFDASARKGHSEFYSDVLPRAVPGFISHRLGPKWFSFISEGSFGQRPMDCQRCSHGGSARAASGENYGSLCDRPAVDLRRRSCSISEEGRCGCVCPADGSLQRILFVEGLFGFAKSRRR